MHYTPTWFHDGSLLQFWNDNFKYQLFVLLKYSYLIDLYYDMIVYVFWLLLVIYMYLVCILLLYVEKCINKIKQTNKHNVYILSPLIADDTVDLFCAGPCKGQCEDSFLSP